MSSSAVLLDLVGRNCHRVVTDVGSFYVFVKSIVSSRQGQRIILNVGNPTEFTFEDVRMTLEVGEGTVRTREVSVSRELRPGYWKEIEVALDQVESRDLQHVTLSVDVAETSLARGI